MIRLQYFARFREQLGIDSESLPWTPALASLRDLRDRLAERGEPWTTTLGHSGLMCARNEALCDWMSRCTMATTWRSSRRSPGANTGTPTPPCSRRLNDPAAHTHRLAILHRYWRARRALASCCTSNAQPGATAGSVALPRASLFN